MSEKYVRAGNNTRQTLSFSDGAAYERYMGRWSRAVGEVFLDWVAPPRSVRWLDVGCGTGVFTELVLDAYAPETVVAVDPSEAQIDIARHKPLAQRADFRVADAQALPFPDGTFDVVASSLVINFIPDPPQALAEMRRVGRPRGVVAGYVWDFATDRGPSSAIRAGLRRVGVQPQASVGAEDTRLPALISLFAGAGLEDIATKVIDVTMSFSDFDEFWQSQTPAYTSTGKMIAAMPAPDREKLIEAVRGGLRVGPDGSFAYSAAQSLAIDPSTATDPVKRMFIFDGEHVTANIATGGEAGSALHTQAAHDEIIIVLEGEAEFQVGAEIRHVAPGDIVFIPENTLHGRVRTTTPKWAALSIYAPYFDRGKKNITWA